MDLSTRRFNSRSRSTEQHNSTSTSKALQIVPPTASGRAQLLANRLQLCGGRLRMAGKASELFYATRYTLPTISRDGVAKRSTGSEQLATWFSGYSCGVRPIGACMVAAPVREKFV